MKRRSAVISSVILIASAVGCQAILGIDDTSFQPDANDAATSDASSDGGLNSDATTNDSGADAASSGPLTFAPARLFVRHGTEADVTVTLNRNGFAGAATITLASLGDAGISADGGDTDDGGPDAASPGTTSGADGISVPTLTIPAGSNTGILHVFAATGAKLGESTLDFTVNEGTNQTASLPILVAGDSGTIDTTFAINGVISDASGSSAHSIAVTGDDSFYIAGSGGAGWLVRHYDSSGNPDVSFNTTMASRLVAAAGTPSRIAVSGSFFAVGGTDGNGDFSIRKYSTAGVIDSTFGMSGLYQLQKGAGGAYAGSVTGLAFTTGGNVVATGANTDLNERFALLFHPSAAETKYAYSGNVITSDVRLDTTGNLIVGGTMSWPDGGANYLAHRLSSAFGDAGAQVSGSPALLITARHAAVGPDGNFYIAAENDGNEPEGAFASFNETTLAPGLLVNTNNNGTSDDGYAGVAVQSDGKIVIDGNAGGSMTNTFVRRFNSNGTVDTSFAASGTFYIQQMSFGPETKFQDVAVDSWNRIIAIGSNTSVGLYITRLWP